MYINNKKDNLILFDIHIFFSRMNINAKIILVMFLVLCKYNAAF